MRQFGAQVSAKSFDGLLVIEPEGTLDYIATLHRRMHKVHAIEEPFLRYVNSDSILHVCRSIGEQNPLYTDSEYASGTHFGSLVAPPARDPIASTGAAPC